MTAQESLKRKIYTGVFGLGLIFCGATFWVTRRSHGRKINEAPASGPSRNTRNIRAGKPLYDELIDSGLTVTQAHDLGRALARVFNPRRIKAGDRYDLMLSSAGQALEFRYWPDALHYFVVARGSDGSWQAEAKELELDDEIVGARGEVSGSLWESMAALNLDAELIYRFADIFAWQIDFLSEPRQGDSFKVVWRRKKNNTVLQEGDILIAEYYGQETGRKMAFLFRDGYYDLSGHSLQRQFLRAPLNFRRISSSFARRRFHPILRYWRPHHGTDYAAAAGTPVVAIGSGRVAHAGWKGSYGKFVKIEHGASYASGYAHLSKIAKGVRLGTMVNQGQVLGYVGSTGGANGPHLHFEFERYGRKINFLREKFPPAKNLTPQEAGDFTPIRKQALVYLSELRPNNEEAMVKMTSATKGAAGAGARRTPRELN